MLNATPNRAQDPPQPAKVLARGTLPALGDCPCAVVQMPGSRDIVRLLSARGFQKTVGIKRRLAHATESGTPNLVFTPQESIKPFINRDIEVVRRPVLYPVRGGLAHGYRAELLPIISSAYVSAYMAGALHPQQHHIARTCAELLKAFAVVGITALIDEASGYQEHRPTDALQELLKAYLRDIPGPWRKVFPDSYYAEAHRLHRLSYTPGCSRHPKVIAFFTKKYVYLPVIPPLVLEAMDHKNPLDVSYARRQAIHQWLTADYGVAAVRAQAGRVEDRARLSADLPHFQALTARAETSSAQLVWGFTDTARWTEVSHA